jgi:DNA-binding LacI/PurR family transcriptional regulator
MIVNGDLKTGDALPSLRELARHLSINLHTVHSAYKLLEIEGLIDLHQGREAKVLEVDSQSIAPLVDSHRTNTIGVIVATLENPFYHSILAGISEEADRNNSLLFVCNSQDDPTEAWRYNLRLRAKQVDGIIAISQSLAEVVYETATHARNKADLPMVSIDWPTARGASVLLDLESAGYQATQHLIEHGHRRIGLITYYVDLDNVTPVNEGYVRALKEAGIPIDASLIAKVKAFDASSGEDGARYLMGLSEPPTAIFAFTDLAAAGALQVLKSMGFRIPEDIALVGFNDIPLAGWLDPPLTSVSTPTYKMGKSAMQMLQKLIDGIPLQQQQITFSVSLVIRKSCGQHQSN